MPFHAPASRKVVQFVYTSTTADASTTAQIPNDDTIPQIGEGTEFITRAITPTNASNILEITFTAYVDCSGTSAAVALFQDATSNALAAAVVAQAATYSVAVLRYVMVAGTTSSTTFRIRYGRVGGSGTTFMLGNTDFGGAEFGVLSVTEYTP